VLCHAGDGIRIGVAAQGVHQQVVTDRLGAARQGHLPPLGIDICDVVYEQGEPLARLGDMLLRATVQLPDVLLLGVENVPGWSCGRSSGLDSDRRQPVEPSMAAGQFSLLGAVGLSTRSHLSPARSGRPGHGSVVCGVWFAAHC
jgi:hypothetical protein